MTVTHHIGSAFDTKLPAVGHGVNTQGVMGSGFAAFLVKEFPEVLEPYQEACKDGSLDGGGLQVLRVHTGILIFNIASQVYPGANAKLDLLESAFEKALAHCELNNIQGIALPRIGARIGGLKWADVEETLNKVMENHPTVEVEIWTLPSEVNLDW